MARFDSAGALYAPPILPESHLEELADRLGLRLLSPDERSEVYMHIGCALGEHRPASLEKVNALREFYYGEAAPPVSEEEDRFWKKGEARFRTIHDRLRKLQGDLAAVTATLDIPEGYVSELDLAARGRVLDALQQLDPSQSSGSVQQFCLLAGKLAAASVAALEELDKQRKQAKRGPEPYVWYDHLTRAAILICEWNRLKPTIGTDTAGEPSGPILEIAAELEMFLPEPLRSETLAGRAKRLKRSMKRIQLTEVRGGTVAAW